MRDTHSVGNLTTAMVLAALLRAGKKVLIPFGDGMRYDLLIDSNGTFIRVQCKTGLFSKGTVRFANCSVGSDGKKKSYGNTVEAFGVYCPQTGKTYLVPTTQCADWETFLRVDESKNKQKKRIRFAKPYEIAGLAQ